MTGDVVTGAASVPEQTRRIPPPSGAREPMKANVFQFMSGGVSELLPLFPYGDAGAIAPCGVVFRGDGEDADWGQFFHYNDVEEVGICFGANGSTLQSGQIYVAQRLHGVNSFLRDPADPEAFAVMTITQRQAEKGEQHEAAIFRCRECQEQLLRKDYNATPQGLESFDPSQWGGSPDDEVPMFVAIWGLTAASNEYNNDESLRTCPKCGHLNPPFPTPKWGWQRYVHQVRVTESARRALRSAAVDAADSKGQ